eukprot:gene17720-37858_t
MSLLTVDGADDGPLRLTLCFDHTAAAPAAAPAAPPADCRVGCRGARGCLLLAGLGPVIPLTVRAVRPGGGSIV